ncbi:unnamed protein product [Paramecium sonneborni]|uniref:Uncharacterized protein n=1 Tax=Paramecium sonneborni TaxID=65129 RepID=A0A8S1R6M5_9CILI|nr:unnamed protein product [Paramecium sonneborni]
MFSSHIFFLCFIFFLEEKKQYLFVKLNFGFAQKYLHRSLMMLDFFKIVQGLQNIIFGFYQMHEISTYLQLQGTLQKKLNQQTPSAISFWLGFAN